MKRSFVATSNLPIRLHLRHDLHLARKTWHMLMGLMIALVYLSGMSCTTCVVILSCFLGLDVLIETARLRVPAFNDKVMRIMSPLMRESEANQVSGTPYYILAALLAIGIFPKPVAILSILYLAFGDPLASLAGIMYGCKSRKIAPGKSLIGTATGVFACALLTWVFSKTLNLSDFQTGVIVVVGGLAGGLAELLPFEIDDNFTIPIFSGFAVWMAFILLGI